MADTEFDAAETLRQLRLTIKQMHSEGDRDYHDIWVAHAKEVVEMIEALDEANAIVTGQHTYTEWGFMHPGYPHVGTGPHVQTSYTGHDGWTTGKYTEENVDSHANGRPVMKRLRTITPDITTEWEPR